MQQSTAQPAAPRQYYYDSKRPSAVTRSEQQQHERIMNGAAGQEVLGQLTRGMTPEQSNALLEQMRGNVPHIPRTKDWRDSLERIDAHYDPTIAEKEAAYYNFSLGGVNPRSPLGKQLMQDRANLYYDWQGVVKEKARVRAEWYTNQYDKPQNALIATAVQDADAILQQQGYTAQNYPQNAQICAFEGNFGTQENLLTAVGSVLNRFTQVSNQEHMTNLYAVQDKAGNVRYVAGPVYTGEKNNVINPYMNDPFGVNARKELQAQYPGEKIAYLGMLHSHPNDRSTDNDGFSWGDALGSAFSGKIFLTTPYGNVYALDGKHGLSMIIPGVIRDELVKLSRKLSNAKIPKYLWNPLLGLYIDYLLPIQDAASSGKNHETFSAKTK